MSGQRRSWTLESEWKPEIDAKAENPAAERENVADRYRASSGHAMALSGQKNGHSGDAGFITREWDMGRRRRQQTAFRQAEPPTPERLARSDAIQIEAPRLPGHDHGNTRTVRFVNRAARWQRDGWIDEEQRRAFDAWEALNDAAQWHPRAVDWQRTGHGSALSARPEAIGDARARFDAIGKLMVAECGHKAVWSVFEWLTSIEPLCYADHFGLGEREARFRAQSMIRKVAASLVAIIRA